MDNIEQFFQSTSPDSRRVTVSFDTSELNEVCFHVKDMGAFYLNIETTRDLYNCLDDVLDLADNPPDNRDLIGKVLKPKPGRWNLSPVAIGFDGHTNLSTGWFHTFTDNSIETIRKKFPAADYDIVEL